MPIFIDLWQKLVMIATPLEQSQRGWIDHATHMCTYSENLLKIGLVQSGIIGLLVDH